MRNKDVFLDSEHRLNLVTRKFEQKSGSLFIVAAPVLILIIAFLFKVIIKIHWSTPLIIGVAVIGIYALINYINTVRKILRNIQGTVLDKQEGNIILNGKILCKEDALRSVIIQPSSGATGLGTSYTVGLDYEGGSIPISYFHEKAEAKDIAKEVAGFYNLEQSTKKAQLFSFLRKF